MFFGKIEVWYVVIYSMKVVYNIVVKFLVNKLISLNKYLKFIKKKIYIYIRFVINNFVFDNFCYIILGIFVLLIYEYYCVIIEFYYVYID